MNSRKDSDAVFAGLVVIVLSILIVVGFSCVRQ